MADVQVIIDDLKGVIGNLTVDNAILRAELRDRDEVIQGYQERDLSNVAAAEATSPDPGTGPSTSDA